MAVINEDVICVKAWLPSQNWESRKKLLEFFTFVRVPLMKRRQDMYFKKIIKKEREQEFSMKLAKLLKSSILVIGFTIAIQVNLINKDKGLR